MPGLLRITLWEDSNTQSQKELSGPAWRETTRTDITAWLFQTLASAVKAEWTASLLGFSSVRNSSALLRYSKKEQPRLSSQPPAAAVASLPSIPLSFKPFLINFTSLG